MSNKCSACGSHIVRPSHFRGHAERKAHPIRSPYRCLACGARFFVISHKARQAALRLFIAICVAFATFGWLFAPEMDTKRQNLPDTTTSSNLRNSPGSSEKATLAEIAKESRCTDQPINVSGETYKCATPSGLTSYFVLPEPKSPVRQFVTDTLEREGAPPR